MNTTESRTVWAIDPSHSELLFKVKHLMITNVKGEFRNFNASVESIGNDFSKARVTATVDADSNYTNNTDRDTHLRSGDFFDVETHKEITFEGTAFNKLDEENYQLKGNLTIKVRINGEVQFVKQ